METELKELLNELKQKQRCAKRVHNRELHSGGNIRECERAWGKLVAYSHCIKQIDKILNYGTYPVLEDAQRSGADSTQGLPRTIRRNGT